MLKLFLFVKTFLFSLITQKITQKSGVRATRRRVGQDLQLLKLDHQKLLLDHSIDRRLDHGSDRLERLDSLVRGEHILIERGERSLQRLNTQT